MFIIDLVLAALLFAAAPDARAEALVALQSGNAAYNAGSFDTAIREFTRAHQLFPSVKILPNLAAAYEKAGQKKAALDTYKKFFTALRQSSEAEIVDLGNRIGAAHVRAQTLAHELGEHELPPLAAISRRSPVLGSQSPPLARSATIRSGDASTPAPPANGGHAGASATTPRLAGAPPPVTALLPNTITPHNDAPTDAVHNSRSTWTKSWVLAIAGSVAIAAGTYFIISSRAQDCPDRGDLGCVGQP